jgi:hypothetical protein
LLLALLLPPDEDADEALGEEDPCELEELLGNGICAA